MASRNYTSNKIYNMHVMPVQLDIKVAIGATGAPTIVSGTGKGITSVTRTAAGKYTIVLQDNYYKLFSLTGHMVGPSGAASGINSIELASDVDADLSQQPFTPGTGGQIFVKTMAPTSSSVTTPIPTDAANGSEMILSFTLSNSSIQ